MAKDPADYSTVDFIAPGLHVTRGQVLMDRQQQIAIVAKQGRDCAYLVRMKSGALKLTRIGAGELVEQWSAADCPFDHAAARLIELGRRHGATDAARDALESLEEFVRQPAQQSLFG